MKLMTMITGPHDNIEKVTSSRVKGQPVMAIEIERKRQLLSYSRDMNQDGANISRSLATRFCQE